MMINLSICIAVLFYLLARECPLDGFVVCIYKLLKNDPGSQFFLVTFYCLTIPLHTLIQQ